MFEDLTNKEKKELLSLEQKELQQNKKRYNKIQAEYNAYHKAHPNLQYTEYGEDDESIAYALEMINLEIRIETQTKHIQELS
jgi:hypothetical protein